MGKRKPRDHLRKRGSLAEPSAAARRAKAVRHKRREATVHMGGNIVLLLETLAQIGLGGAALESLPIELPLGQKMEPADFEGCMRRYQAAAAYAGNGVGLLP